ncbi:DUF1835 domain-containing protein [Radiobacillus kanasensis]|uniref:DUF1835 domain-containing protein n=1 Tax=Radiobacillus kanasensis TaxID=2844358 RepID=UPI001E518C22|nr:DUF1835 domain-containing protein [Radiobacillus kanasensis]UFU00146.1 DUF1835 domain-containing protein [Radiobacillus kanasensis]
MVKFSKKELFVIKSKINYPFIYFFMEPNVVFVYKVKTQDYLTISDLKENGEWQTFELKHEEEFETFTHEESKPLEGRGYLIKQDDLNIIVEKINKYIIKYRHLLSISASSDEVAYKASAVHIVSSESAAGSLKVGLKKSNIVIGFPDSLSIGPLWKLNEKVGQTFRNEWLYEHINYEQDDYEYENKFTNTLREIEDIPQQVPIYIWYGNNVDEQTALRFLLFLIRAKTNDVFLMNSTELYDRYIRPKSTGQQIFHTGHIEPKDLRLLFEKNRKNPPIFEQERIQFHSEWNSLAQTKEMLRLWMKDEIKGVKEDYYDSLIINTIETLHLEQGKKDFIMTGRVIEEILSVMNGLINPFFLEYRIRHLIYSGVLELKGIPKSMRHYSVNLR